MMIFPISLTLLEDAQCPWKMHLTPPTSLEDAQLPLTHDRGILKGHHAPKGPRTVSSKTPLKGFLKDLVI